MTVPLSTVGARPLITTGDGKEKQTPARRTPQVHKHRRAIDIAVEEILGARGATEAASSESTSRHRRAPGRSFTRRCRIIRPGDYDPGIAPTVLASPQGASLAKGRYKLSARSAGF
jgi:hypothetical protein